MISARDLARQHLPKVVRQLEQMRARPTKDAVAGNPGSRTNSQTSDSPCERPSVYWWRLPDDEAMLMSLRPAELKCYLVVARAIQRDRNEGKLSIRQIAERAQLSPKHAHTAVAGLVDRGLLACRVRPGVTGVYRLPSEWRNRTPTREQLEREPEVQGEQNCVPTGEQNCTPTGERHLELSEYSELSSSREQSGRFENTAAEGESTTTSPSTENNRPPSPRAWSPTAEETEQARGELQRHFGSPMLPDMSLTLQVLAYMNGPEDVRLWLLDLVGRRVRPMGWGFYLTDAATWPTRRPDVAGQVDVARTARKLSEVRSDTPEPSPKPLLSVHATVESKAPERPMCQRCENTGAREAAHDRFLCEWCSCEHGERRRQDEPDFVVKQNAAVEKLRNLNPGQKGPTENYA